MDTIHNASIADESIWHQQTPLHVLLAACRIERRNQATYTQHQRNVPHE